MKFSSSTDRQSPTHTLNDRPPTVRVCFRVLEALQGTRRRGQHRQAPTLPVPSEPHLARPCTGRLLHLLALQPEPRPERLALCHVDELVLGVSSSVPVPCPQLCPAHAPFNLPSLRPLVQNPSLLTTRWEREPRATPLSPGPRKLWVRPTRRSRDGPGRPNSVM